MKLSKDVFRKNIKEFTGFQEKEKRQITNYLDRRKEKGNIAEGRKNAGKSEKKEEKSLRSCFMSSIDDKNRRTTN